MANKNYQTIGAASDVAVIDTGHFGNEGIEIETRQGWRWSGLSAGAAIEQLEILREKYALQVPEECIDDLAAEQGGELMAACAGPPLPDAYADVFGLAAV